MFYKYYSTRTLNRFHRIRKLELGSTLPSYFQRCRGPGRASVAGPGRTWTSESCRCPLAAGEKLLEQISTNWWTFVTVGCNRESTYGKSLDNYSLIFSFVAALILILNVSVCIWARLAIFLMGTRLHVQWIYYGWWNWTNQKVLSKIEKLNLLF